MPALPLRGDAGMPPVEFDSTAEKLGLVPAYGKNLMCLRHTRIFTSGASAGKEQTIALVQTHAHESELRLIAPATHVDLNSPLVAVATHTPEYRRVGHPATRN